jgi:two-component system sensor histidine kinase HydH
MSKAGQRKSFTRHGILATALLLGLSLVLSTYSAFRDAEALADTVSEGQSEVYLRAMHDRAKGHPPADEDIASMIVEYADRGLIGAGVLDREGKVRTIAGTITETPPNKRRLRGRSLVRVGDRYQIIAPPHHRPEGAPPPPLGPHFGADEPPMGPPPIVFEFEPLLASGLTRRARDTFVLSTSVAVLLVVTALVLFRRAGKQEALADKLVQSERLASLGTMSAVLAHEIKNPLASLKGNAQLVAEALPSGSKGRDQADRVVTAAQRLQELVQNLLDFARGGAIERAEADPAELLFLAAEDAAPGAVLHLDEAPPSWSLDVIRMRQVLENVLRNAVQASKNGTIEAKVSVDARTGALVYVVRDDGPGFPEGGIESSFEPFFTTKTRGVGLGLAVARRVVEMHGGTIAAKNRREGGAELRITIPRGGEEK